EGTVQLLKERRLVFPRVCPKRVARFFAIANVQQSDYVHEAAIRVTFHVYEPLGVGGSEHREIKYVHLLVANRHSLQRVTVRASASLRPLRLAPRMKGVGELLRLPKPPRVTYSTATAAPSMRRAAARILTTSR